MNINTKNKKIAIYTYILYACIVICFLLGSDHIWRQTQTLGLIVFCVIIPMMLYGGYYLCNEFLNKKKVQAKGIKCETPNSNISSQCISDKLGILESWPLMTFAEGKRMQVGSFINKDTKDYFKACIFTDLQTEEKTYVAFSSLLGELTPNEIAERKEDLLVVKLDSGNYSLCAKRSNILQTVNL